MSGACVRMERRSGEDVDHGPLETERHAQHRDTGRSGGCRSSGGVGGGAVLGASRCCGLSRYADRGSVCGWSKFTTQSHGTPSSPTVRSIFRHYGRARIHQPAFPEVETKVTW